MESYPVKSWVTPMEFEYWSGAKNTVKYLTLNELETIWSYLFETHDVLEDTDINDFFWFETDMIAEILGYSSFDEIMEREDNENQ